MILDKEQFARLGQDFKFCVWEPVDEDHTAVRFATSWATREEDVDTLLSMI